MAVKDVGIDGEHYAYDRAGNYIVLSQENGMKWR